MKEIPCCGCHVNLVEVEDDFEFEHCCIGLANECGCMGLPINPVFCRECEEKIFGIK